MNKYWLKLSDGRDLLVFADDYLHAIRKAIGKGHNLN